MSRKWELWFACRSGGPHTRGGEPVCCGEAFRELEGRLGDCVSLARIAAEKMPSDANGDAFFAVVHSFEMLRKLQKDYYHAYHDEKQGGLHTSSI